MPKRRCNNHPRISVLPCNGVETPWSRRRDDDPFAVLGVPAGADEATITAARRQLAKRAHPDAGGSIEEMQRLNDAAERAIASLTSNNRSAGGPSRAAEPRGARRRPPRPAWRGGAVRHDHPSFTIEALPVEAFEGLSIAAAWLGEVVDDDPPYLLEAVLTDPVRAWCRLELVPDAGASSVSLTVARVPDGPMPDVDDVRDRWINALNGLDWTRLDPTQPRPW